MNIKTYSIEELNTLAKDIRKKILETVSKNGGHLSSTMGATDLIVAMHKVFDVEKDPFIFDVSHQAYAHKLLTGRWDDFDTLRQFNGVCGYTKPSESKYDYYVAGHSSTSISLAVGAAKAIALKGEDRVALIGFGSFSVSTREARTGRNPQTGKPIDIPAKKVIKFKAGSELVEVIQ
jgi:1-deoxy-D-xylulose-5-phosphate synthase